MPIMEAWRQQGRDKYSKTGTLLFSARTTTLQNTVHTSERRA